MTTTHFVSIFACFIAFTSVCQGAVLLYSLTYAQVRLVFIVEKTLSGSEHKMLLFCCRRVTQRALNPHFARARTIAGEKFTALFVPSYATDDRYKIVGGAPPIETTYGVHIVTNGRKSPPSSIQGPYCDGNASLRTCFVRFLNVRHTLTSQLCNFTAREQLRCLHHCVSLLTTTTLAARLL